MITTIAGADWLFPGDGSPAVGAPFSNGILGLAFSPAGELHISDLFNRMVFKVRRDGILEVVAGNGSSVSSGLGGDPRRAGIFPAGIAFTPDDQLYIVEFDGDLLAIADGKPER